MRWRSRGSFEGRTLAALKPFEPIFVVRIARASLGPAGMEQALEAIRVERAVPLLCCPECQKPMSLVRVLPALDDLPRLGAFYCKPCQFAATEPVLPA